MTRDCLCDEREGSLYCINFCVLRQTGDILIENEISYNHHEYCILHEAHAETNESTTSVLVCFNDNNEVQTRHNILSYGMNYERVQNIHSIQFK